MNHLKHALNKGVSHAYITTCQSEERCEEMANILARMAVCSADTRKPCCSCRDCGKAQDNTHPDVIHIYRQMNDKGIMKKEIQVHQIREMIEQAYIMPNEADNKVFIIHEAERMNDQAQNALLKLLEEPPRGVVMILITTAPASLLETVRSRCVLVREVEEAPPMAQKMQEQVQEYLRHIAKGSRADLLRWCMEQAAQLHTLQVDELLEAVQDVLVEIACGQLPNPGLSVPQQQHILQLTETCRRYLTVNTGVKHVFGLLAVQSIGD